MAAQPWREVDRRNQVSKSYALLTPLCIETFLSSLSAIRSVSSFSKPGSEFAKHGQSRPLIKARLRIASTVLPVENFPNFGTAHSQKRTSEDAWTANRFPKPINSDI